jgi:ATP-dependent helicase/nuclease subunit B
MARLRRRFVRQLRAVSEAVTFFVPRRNAAGMRQSPSDSLVFINRLFQGADDAQALIFELDSTVGRAAARGLVLAPPEPPEPPRPLTAQDLDFDRDLVALRLDSAGNPKPESPSSLETLLVSRLAWLLRRLRAEPLGWAPEEANPLLLGSIAHMVFERLFYPGRPLPEEDEIVAAMDGHLDEVTRQMAPFLRGPQWQVEMRHFREQTTVAALAWRRTLVALNAEILANEVWLQGTWSGMPVHGQADLILGLAAGRLLVVDYKRSSSSSRRPRMEKGYDCQASLYRLMLQTEGLKYADDEALALRLRSASHTGVVYYLLNDQVSLTDTALPESGQIAGWQLIENDVSGQAMALLAHRLDEVRVGQLHLNREGDAEYFKKQAGITPYALEASPLIELFTLPGDAEELP